MKWFSYQQTKLSEKQGELVEKLLLSILNGFDRLTKSERLDQSDLTPHEVILKEGLLSVRKYAPLSDEEILIGGEKDSSAFRRTSYSSRTGSAFVGSAFFIRHFSTKKFSTLSAG